MGLPRKRWPEKRVVSCRAMRERLRLEGELSDLGLRPSAHELAAATASAPATAPQVMFEFDVHYGFRDNIDGQLGQTVPGHVRLTRHRNDTEFFNVKRDFARLEIGTAHFPLDTVGLANIEVAKTNIKKFTAALAKGCRHAKLMDTVVALSRRLNA